MATNKNAQIRYQALDRCLSNWGRRYYIEDLVEACNEALYNYNGDTKDDGGVKKRQVQADLVFMESEEGLSTADIKQVKEDVLPFVRNPKELDIWSNDYFVQLADMVRIE